jgi:hypothetical protein
LPEVDLKDFEGRLNESVKILNHLIKDIKNFNEDKIQGSPTFQDADNKRVETAHDDLLDTAEDYKGLVNKILEGGAKLQNEAHNLLDI